MRHTSPGPARPRAPIWVIGAGGILGLATVLASAFNALSAPQSVALASGLAIGGGLLAHVAVALLPELQIAWQRGFQRGLEAGRRAKPAPHRARALKVVSSGISARPGAEAADHGPGQASDEAGAPGKRGAQQT